MPSPPPDEPDLYTRLAVAARSGNRCVCCGGFGATVHHRRPRGMGGTRNPHIHSPANLLWVCGTGTTGCHGWIEQHRADARNNGWLIPPTVDPTTIPVHLWDGRWVVLDHHGHAHPS